MTEERKIGMREILVFFVKKYKDQWEKVYSAICEKERVSPEEAFKVADELAERNISYITMVDEDYPNQYKSIYKPPFVIFEQNGKTTTKLYELL